jgi:type I restriction enzyme S subunit
MSELLETEIGTIGPDWKVEPLERVCELPQYGFTASAEDKGNVRLLRITDITDSGVKWPSVPFCDCPTELLNKFLLASGDIVFARIGATTGKSYLIKDPPPCVFASYLIRVRTKHEIDPLFLSQFFRSVAYWRQVNAQKNANLKKGVSGSLLKKLVVPVPPLPEQWKIAGVLELVQRALEQQERLMALTTELKKALLHQLFTQGLRGEPQKQTDIGPIPQSWEVVPLRDCCTVQTGVAKGRKVDKKEALTLPYLRVANVQSGYLDLSEMKTVTIRTKERARYLLQKGDIVLTEGGDFDKLGRGFIWKGEVNDCIHQNHIFAVRVNGSCLLPEFFAQLSQSPYGKAYFLSVAHKTTNLACINTTKLKGFPVLVPTKAEQEEIVQMLESVDNKLAHHTRKKQILYDLFRTLLHKLMTAQIRIHDLDLPELGIKQ